MNRATGILIASLLAVAGPAAAEDIAPDAVVIGDDMAVAQSLTGTAGDPAEGAKVFKNRSLGNCLACHANADMPNDLFHGNVGPEMNGVADRWSPEELRAILVDSKKIFGDQTVMPGFYSLNVGVDVRKDLVGKTILTAQQVEDVVAYLGTLKE
jgi:sulfur-oxidizing protein SoxX